MMIAANFYDGRSARSHAVELATADGVLTLRGDVERTYAAQATRIAEPFEQAPTVLYFEDGARCEVAGHEAGRLLRDALGYRASRVVRMTAHTWAALIALVLLVALILATMIWGVPAASKRIAAALPPSVDRSLGETAFKALENSGTLQASRLSEQWLAEVNAALPRVAPPDMRVRLLVRSSPKLGANAIALPDGTIVMTDQMVRFIVGRKGNFGAAEKAQLAGILAHEIGHVRMRHGARILAGSSLSAALAAALFGDFSGVATLPAVVMRLSYSREAEAEADGFAIALMQKNGIPMLPLAALHERMEQRFSDDGQKEGASWVRDAARFMTSHPGSRERAARLRAAALQAPP
jgi:Zn-dependent protease with chaperone function